MGTYGFSGFLSGGSGSGPPGSGGYASIYKVAGTGDGPTVGLNTYAPAELLGATEFNIITVNNNTETINEDFTFDGTTITRTNAWATGDKLIVNYKPA